MLNVIFCCGRSRTPRQPERECRCAPKGMSSQNWRRCVSRQVHVRELESEIAMRYLSLLYREKAPAAAHLAPRAPASLEEPKFESRFLKQMIKQDGEGLQRVRCCLTEAKHSEILNFCYFVERSRYSNFSYSKTSFVNRSRIADQSRQSDSGRAGCRGKTLPPVACRRPPATATGGLAYCADRSDFSPLV